MKKCLEIWKTQIIKINYKNNAELWIEDNQEVQYLIGSWRWPMISTKFMRRKIYFMMMINCCRWLKKKRIFNLLSWILFKLCLLKSLLKSMIKDWNSKVILLILFTSIQKDQVSWKLHTPLMMRSITLEKVIAAWNFTAKRAKILHPFWKLSHRSKKLKKLIKYQ